MDHREAELEALLKANARLQQENDLFASHLQHSQPSHADEDEAESKSKDKGRGKRKQRAAATLSVEQKHDIASSEFEEIQKEIEETKANSEKLIDTLRAVLEETDIRIAELKKDAYEFKRDIVVGAENFRTGKTMAEKVTRYMDEKLKQKDAIIEKLRLKNATLKSQIQKVDAQLKQKEEMGDVLHYIDFHQLQIENKQYMAKIEERNQELLRLKMTTGNTVQVLNSLKKRLGALISDSEWLKREIKNRTELLEKIQSDNRKVKDEVVKEQRVYRKLTSAAEESADMPHILDYVSQKAEMYELENACKNWERKLEIAELEAKKNRRRQGSRQA